jgi:hypothetical protein
MEQPIIYKGMPRLSYADIKEELIDAFNSPYFLWYEYLKLSKDYWWVCKLMGETQDAELKAMYWDFGDVHEVEFRDWWLDRGRYLFAEQVQLPKVSLVYKESLNINPTPQNHVLLEIPLNLTERTISKQVLAIIRAQQNRAVKRVSQAKRPLAKLSGLRRDVMKKAHYIWRLNRLITLSKQPNSTIGKPFNTATSQQIGITMGLAPSCLPKRFDTPEKERKKRNGMKVAVSRMLQRANALIANAEIGIFPSFEEVAQRIRWTDEQQLELNAAVYRGEWQPEANDEEFFRKVLNESKNTNSVNSKKTF